MNIDWMENEKEKYSCWNGDNADRLPSIISGEYIRLFRLLQNKNVFGLFLQIKDTYEILLKTLVLIAVTLEKRNGINENNGDWLFKFFEKDLSLGDWSTIGSSYSKITSDEYLKRIMGKTKALMDNSDIIKWRNDWVGHGALAQETNEEFISSIRDKIEFIYNFVKDNIEDLEKINLFLDNDRWRIIYKTENIDLYPWIVRKGDRTYLFDSYRSTKGKFVYLDYENGGKDENIIDELKELVESLHMQNEARKFISKSSSDLILTSEEMVVKELIKTQNYIRPEYLCQKIMEFIKLPKGIMLLQMGEGFGKTLLTTALDGNGLNRIKLPDCTTRAYYINDTYASNVDYFISNMYDLFRIDRDGKILYRGNLPMLSKHDENPSQKLCDLLSFYREKREHSKLFFVLDGIDEIVSDGGFSILDFIPEETEIPEGVYILCTCRNDKELGGIPDVYRKIHQLNFTKKLNFDIHSEEYAKFLKAYVKKKVPKATPEICQELIELANYKFDRIDKICKRIGWDKDFDIHALDMPRWDLDYLAKMFGEKYFNQIIIYLSSLYIINESLTVKELCYLCFERDATFQDLYLIWYMQDLLKIDRNRKGNKISIKSKTVGEYFSNNYSDKLVNEAKSIYNKLIAEDFTINRNNIIIAKNVSSIISFQNEKIIKNDLDKIVDNITKIEKDIDFKKITNILDTIGIYDSILYMFKMEGLKSNNILVLEIMAKQAELYEIYGQLNVAKYKYDQCINNMSIIKNSNVQDYINIKIKYSMLLDKLGIANETLRVLNEIIEEISRSNMSQENMMLLYANKGHILQKMGKNSEALTELNKAIYILENAEILKKDAYQASLCYLNRSTLIYSVESDKGKAVEDLKKAILFTEGSANNAIRINRARALLNHVYIIDKEKIDGDVNLKLDEAIDILEGILLSDELFEIDTLANAYCNKGLLLEKKGDIEAAIDEYMKAVIMLESYHIQGRCYCLLELYKAYHLLLEKGKSFEDKIFDMLVENVDLSRFEYVTWAVSAWRDLFERDYKKQELLKMCSDWIDNFYIYKQIFLSEDLKAIIAMVVCCEEEFIHNGLHKEAIRILEKTCEIKMFNNEIDEVYAFLMKQMGLNFIKDNNLDAGNTCYEKSIKVYTEIMNNDKLENGNEFIVLCANKGIVNLHQQKFQDAYDTFYLGVQISNEELKKGTEVDEEVVLLILKNITMLINHREDANIIVY